MTDGTRVLIFNTCADASRAARLHAPECAMVNTARKNRRPLYTVTAAQLDADVADLNERGYPVKTCKCLKETGR